MNTYIKVKYILYIDNLNVGHSSLTNVNLSNLLTQSKKEQYFYRFYQP